jgi:hypothetical protein
MRLVVKSHQAFFADSCLAARTLHAATVTGGRVPAPSSAAFCSRRRSPRTPGGRAAAGTERCSSPRPPALTACLLRSAGVSSARAQRPDYRLSVGDRPRPPAPATVYAQGVRHAAARAHPSNERCPCGSPGGTTAALSDPAAAATAADFLMVRSPGNLCLGTCWLQATAASATARLACRRAVESTSRRQSFSAAPSGSSPCST